MRGSLTLVIWKHKQDMYILINHQQEATSVMISHHIDYVNKDNIIAVELAGEYEVDKKLFVHLLDVST